MLQSRLLRAGGVFGKSRGGVVWGLSKRRGMSSEDSLATQGTAPTPGTAPLPTGKSADPAIHASEPLGADADAAAIAAAATKPPPRTQSDESEPLVPPYPSHTSSPKLAHTEVGLPSKPNTQQRRPFSNQAAQQQQQQQSGPDPLADASCAGLDGSPWSDDIESRKAQNKAQEEDNKDYFKDHKASPLSEIEFVDTRKPITRATDQNVDKQSAGSYYGGGEGMSVWLPEQELSAEETLLRVAELWQWNRMRGDPESPHGRVLRELRGEYW